MMLVRATDIVHGATPINHGRTPAVRLVLDERRKLLAEAARFFPGQSRRETARQLHTALSRYRDGRWRRDRAEATCPMQHRGKLLQVMWTILKVRDQLPSMVTIRRSL
ncbi:MAG: hypothetical protein C0480_01150 [Bradyrhizobium sp.]|nr:hypothetical protein [Bradyrhizobium sp.]